MAKNFTDPFSAYETFHFAIFTNSALSASPFRSVQKENVPL